MTITIVSSNILYGSVQMDGSLYITETHVLSDGRTIEFEYLSDGSVNVEEVKTLRARRIQAELQAREVSEGLASDGIAPLTKYQFRQLFTFYERISIDAFNAGFETNDVLSVEQKAAIRTNLEDYKSSGAVYLNNPSTIAGVNLYESLGLIASGRAAEILAQ